MQVDYEHFSHNEFDIPLNPDRVKSIPLSLDPPEHTPYRRLLMGGFMPKKVRQYSEVARETAPPSLSLTSNVSCSTDRKSVVSGKSVSVRVDLGGRRIIKKNKTHLNR